MLHECSSVCEDRNRRGMWDIHTQQGVILHCAGLLAQDMTNGVYHVAGCNLHQYPRQTSVKDTRQNLVLGAGEMERT